MKINRIFLCSFAAAAICACQTEKLNQDAPEVPSYTVSFVANTETDGRDPDAKATVGTNASGKMQTFWENGDRISVYSEGNGASNNVLYAFETSLSSPSASATFGYTGNDFVQGDHYLAIYPHTESSTRAANFTNTRMAQVDVPVNQTLVAGGFDGNAVVMLAYSDNLNSMDFMNAVALVKFRVADEGVTSGSIYARTAKIAGRFRGDVLQEDGKYTTALVEYSSGSTNAPASTLNFSVGDGTALQRGTDYYVAVRPTTLEDGFTVSLNGESVKTYYITEFKRNTIYNLGTLSLPEPEEDEDDDLTLEFDFTSKTPLSGWPSSDNWTETADVKEQTYYPLNGVDYEFLCADCSDATSKRTFWNSNGYIVLNATGRYLGLPLVEGYRLVAVEATHATSAKSRKVGVAAEIVDSKSTPVFVSGGDLMTKTFAVGEVIKFNLRETTSSSRSYLYTASGIGFSKITLTYEKVTGESATADAVRIGTYNLRYINDKETDEANLWENRKDRVIQSIEDNDFDIFAVQECSEGIRTYLESELSSSYAGSYFNPYSATGVADSDKVEYIGILYKKSEYTLSGWQKFWLADDIAKIGSRPVVRNDNDSDGNTYYRGGCCCVLTDSDNDKIFVMTTHGCLSEEKRALYAPVLAQIEKKYNTGGYPSFFIGDMNARPSDQASVEYRKYWNDVYRSVSPDMISGPFATYNGFDLSRDLDTDPKRLDYVYYRGATPLNYICNSRKYDGYYASDHLPVSADMLLSVE